MYKSLLIRILPFIVTALLCTLGIVLGNWQTRRATEKDEVALQIQMQMQKAPTSLNVSDASDTFKGLKEFQSVKISGQFLREWPIYVDNRPLNGQAGFYVLMPFRIEKTAQTILVERGWIRRDPVDRIKLPTLNTPDGVIEIEGTLRQHVDRVMQLGQQETIKPGAIVQNMSVEAFRRASHFSVLDFVLEQTSSQDDGLVRDWPQASAGAQKHRAYAFQWYGLAIMAFLFFVVTGIRRGKNRT